MDAAGQNFYSLGIGFGSISLFATGNKPSNSFYEDALVYALGNGMTSMLASIIIFSFFGFTVNYKLKHCEVNTTMSTISIPQVPCNRTAILDEVRQASGILQCIGASLQAPSTYMYKQLAS